jgi:hypothetical protein
MVKKVIKKVEVPFKDIEEPDEEIQDEPKKKRVMTKEQLEHLARIRDLAAAKKRELKERDTKVRNLEKEKLNLKAQEYDKIQEEKERLNKKVTEEVIHKVKETKKASKIIVKEESTDEEDNNYHSESDEEEQAVVQTKQRSHRNKPKKISDYDDETIHHVAFQASQAKLLQKVMSNRILGNLTNYQSQMAMKYY